MLQVFILFYRKQHMKALLEYLLDSSVTILLHDLRRRKNILMVTAKLLYDHDGCNMDWWFCTVPYTTNVALLYFSVLSACTSNAV